MQACYRIGHFQTEKGRDTSGAYGHVSCPPSAGCWPLPTAVPQVELLAFSQLRHAHAVAFATTPHPSPACTAAAPLPRRAADTSISGGHG